MYGFYRPKDLKNNNLQKLLIQNKQDILDAGTLPDFDEWSEGERGKLEKNFGKP